MKKLHIVDAESGKICPTCKKIGSHQGRPYCGRFVTAHDGEYAEPELVRFLRGDSCHVAWEPKTAPIIATPNGWFDLGTGKIVDVPDRPVAGEPGVEPGSFAMGLSAGGTVHDAPPAQEQPAWRFVIPEDEGKDIPFTCPDSPDRVLNAAKWPEDNHPDTTPVAVNEGKSYFLEPGMISRGANYAGGGGRGDAGLAEIVYGEGGAIVAINLIGAGGALDATLSLEGEPAIIPAAPEPDESEPHAETKFIPLDRVWEAIAVSASASDGPVSRAAREAIMDEIKRLEAECRTFPEVFEPKGER